MQTVKKEFKLVKKINLAEKQKKKQQTIIWKDLIEEMSQTNDGPKEMKE